MKKVRLLLPGIIAIVFAIQVLAQDRKLQMHAVAFYNLENLFDTCHDICNNIFRIGYGFNSNSGPFHMCFLFLLGRN